MKQLFNRGDVKKYSRVVTPDDYAAFHGAVVHPVASTYALARDIEWTTRQFVLDMRDDDEEGVGTFLSIEHKRPAFAGETMLFTGTYESLDNGELICHVQVTVGERIVALAKTGQKILKRDKIQKLFGSHG